MHFSWALSEQDQGHTSQHLPSFLNVFVSCFFEIAYQQLVVCSKLGTAVPNSLDSSKRTPASHRAHFAIGIQDVDLDRCFEVLLNLDLPYRSLQWCRGDVRARVDKTFSLLLSFVRLLLSASKFRDLRFLLRQGNLCFSC